MFFSFILRPLARDALRTLLSVIAVALGIGAVVAIQLANRGAISSFQESVTEIAGRANLVISAPGPFDEELLARAYRAFAGDPEIEMSPVIEGTAVAANSGEVLEVLALDLATDRAIRDFNVRGASQGMASSRDLLLLLTDPRSLLLGGGFASRHGLAVGNGLDLLVNDRRERFTVRGILAGSGPAQSLVGNIAVMDIAAGQMLYGRHGLLDRIDLVVPEERLAGARERLNALLGPGQRVDRPRARGEQIEKMLRAFRLNLSALSLVSLIVGAFLIYNTVAVAVVRRRAEVGALRAVGATRARIVALFLAEAVLIGLAGSLAGVLLGRVASGKALELVSATVKSLWVASALPAPAKLTPALVIAACAIGAAIAALSALAPALEAGSVDPAEALRRGAHERARRQRSRRDAAWGLAVLAGAYGAAQLPPLRGGPVFGYAAALLLVGGCSLMMPLAVSTFSRLSAMALRRARTTTGMLAARSLGASLGRASVLAMALATAIAMMASVAIMVTSFRRTVETWTDQTLRADLFLRAAANSRGRLPDATISPDTIAAVSSTPGVAAVDIFRSMEISFRGEPAFLATGDWEVLRRHGNLMFLDGRSAADVLAPGRRDPPPVVISEPFSLRHKVKAGETVLLPAPGGERVFFVRGVYYDYSNDLGTAVMHRADWLRLGGDPAATNLAVYLAPGAGAAELGEVRREIVRRTEGRALHISENRELRAAVLRVFDRTFAITWVLEVIAVCVAVLGIANALLAMVLERRREIGILRYLGATRRQVQRLVFFEAGLLGLLASAAGLLLGLGLSLVLIYVVNRQSFGWTIQFSLPVPFLALATLAVFAATCLSAWYPGRQAAAIDPVEAVTIE